MADLSATTTATDQPEALQSPTKPVGLGFQLFLGLANFAFYFGFYPATQYLIPTQVDGLGHTTAITNVAIVATVGAFTGLIGNPLFGALSDRTTMRLGRRRPWLLICSAMSVLALGLMAIAPNVAVLAIGWGAEQFFLNGVLAALSALIPDRIPERQRGVVSSIVGFSIPLAVIVGAIVIGKSIHSYQIGYGVIAAVVLVIIGLFALFLREPSLAAEHVAPFQIGQFLGAFRVDFRKNPDFGLAWITRFLVILGYALGTGSFAYFFLRDVIKYDQTIAPGHTITEGLATLSLISTLVLLPATIFFGILSDRVQRRKPFVIAASVVIAIGLIQIAVNPTWQGAIIANIIIGLGFGAYLGIDLALITQVLPSAQNRAKDLGIINIANTLPQTIAPFIAAVLINSFAVGSAFGYQVLFVAAGIVTLFGAVLVQPIKSVR